MSLPLDTLLARIKATAVERDARGGHAAEEKALLRDAGLLELSIPRAYGGEERPWPEIYALVRRIAAVDSALAHVFAFHHLQVATVLIYGNVEQQERLLRQTIERRLWWGNGMNPLDRRLLARQTADGLLLDGVKSFCSGIVGSQLMTLSAVLNDAAQPLLAVVPVEQPGVRILDDWDGIGQQYTGSGTTHFDNVRVEHDELLQRNTTSKSNALPQLYLHALIAGILRNLVSDAAALLQRRARSFSHAVTPRPADDPQLLQVVGQLSSSAFAAEAIVLAAAEALERAFTAAARGEGDPALDHEASLRAAQAKVVVDELALKAASELFDVGGASAARRSAHLDRHWRNIRTLASHNPAAYKARAIGDLLVNGTELPRNAYF